jgi:hypothetical protein
VRFRTDPMRAQAEDDCCGTTCLSLPSQIL